MRNVLSPADLIQSAMNETFWKSPRCWRTSVTQTLARFRCSVNWPLKSAGLAAMAAASYVSTLVGVGARVTVRVDQGCGQG